MSQKWKTVQRKKKKKESARKTKLKYKALGKYQQNKYVQRSDVKIDYKYRHGKQSYPNHRTSVFGGKKVKKKSKPLRTPSMIEKRERERNKQFAPYLNKLLMNFEIESVFLFLPVRDISKIILSGKTLNKRLSDDFWEDLNRRDWKITERKLEDVIKKYKSYPIDSVSSWNWKECYKFNKKYYLSAASYMFSNLNRRLAIDFDFVKMRFFSTFSDRDGSDIDEDDIKGKIVSFDFVRKEIVLNRTYKRCITYWKLGNRERDFDRNERIFTTKITMKEFVWPFQQHVANGKILKRKKMKQVKRQF